VEYLYDVFDRRIGRKLDTSAPFDMASAVIERYVLDDIHNGLASADGGNVVLDFVDPDGSGAQAIAMSKRYLYGEAVDQVFAQEDLSKSLGDAARNLWPLVDHLGTVRDLAKQDGTIAVHYKYDSFGNVKSGDTSKTRYLFTSREFDTATKLQYNRARYYDAAVGRWISEDPLGFVAGDAALHRYCANSPTISVDSTGRDRRIGVWYSHAILAIRNPETGEEWWLEFGPIGYTMQQPYEKWWPGAKAIQPWRPSTPREDQLLIDLWKTLEKERRRGQQNTWLLPFPNLLWNCWSPVLMFQNYGIGEFAAPAIPPPVSGVPDSPWWLPTVKWDPGKI